MGLSCPEHGANLSLLRTIKKKEFSTSQDFFPTSTPLRASEGEITGRKLRHTRWLIEVTDTWANASVLSFPAVQLLLSHWGQTASLFFLKPNFLVCQKRLTLVTVSQSYRMVPSGCWVILSKRQLYRDRSHMPSNPAEVILSQLCSEQDVLQESESEEGSPHPGAYRPRSPRHTTYPSAFPISGQEAHRVSFFSFGPLKYEL